MEVAYCLRENEIFLATHWKPNIEEILFLFTFGLRLFLFYPCFILCQSRDHDDDDEGLGFWLMMNVTVFDVKAWEWNKDSLTIMEMQEAEL
jgi:hypothetical protein